jgi:pimeloyl-ACP methyl ester carboxylesterase
MAPRAHFTSRFVDVRTDSLSLRIHALCSRGEGAGLVPVVFVPGLGASAPTMLPTAQLMPAEPDLYIVEPPGHGRSEAPKRALTMVEFAAVTAASLDAFSLAPRMLVGHSFGSQIVVQLAVDRPALAAAVVLISPTVDPRARSIPRQFFRLAHDAFREPRGLLRLLARSYFVSAAGLLRIGRAAVRDRVEDKLPRIQAPTLVVRGGRDPLVPARWAAEVTSLVPQARLVLVPRGTHAVQYQSPESVARALREFIAETTPSWPPAA